MKVLLCPSEPNTMPQDPKKPFGISNYGWSVGDWYVFGGGGRPADRSAFAVDTSRNLSAFTDGLSNTVLSAEVKASQLLYKSCAVPGSMTPTSFPSPADSPAFVAANYTNGCKSDLGHVKWSIGSACFDGFTTAITPNTEVMVGNHAQHVDYDTNGENNGGPTYAAITSRIHHPGDVNALFGDGSVRFIKSTVDGLTWRALGTIGGGEVISADAS